MKIDRILPPSEAFGGLGVGSAFEYKDTIYIKTSSFTSPAGGTINAVALSSGIVVGLLSCTTVLPCPKAVVKVNGDPE